MKEKSLLSEPALPVGAYQLKLTESGITFSGIKSIFFSSALPLLQRKPPEINEGGIIDDGLSRGEVGFDLFG